MKTKREALIQTAIRLFSEYGYHHTGVDRIVREAGITKKTLYSYFHSKEELIVAALRHHDNAFRQEFMRSVESTSRTPSLRLLAIFDVAGVWFEENHFFGCMFINAAGEFTASNSEIREICRHYKDKMTSYICRLAKQAHARDPDNLALQLALLLEGAIVTAQVSGSAESAQRAKAIAKTLVDQQLSNSEKLAEHSFDKIS